MGGSAFTGGNRGYGDNDECPNDEWCEVHSLCSSLRPKPDWLVWRGQSFSAARMYGRLHNATTFGGLLFSADRGFGHALCLKAGADRFAYGRRRLGSSAAGCVWFKAYPILWLAPGIYVASGEGAVFTALPLTTRCQVSFPFIPYTLSLVTLRLHRHWTLQIDSEKSVIFRGLKIDV